MNNVVVKELEKFDILFAPQQNEGFAVSDLQNKQKSISFLEKQMIEMKAPNLFVTASMILKRYAYLVVSSTLYSMAEYNCALNLPVNACTLSKDRKLCIQADFCIWKEINNDCREKWREKVLHELFSSHITPVIEGLRKATRIPSSILWENVAVRINSTYRKILAEQPDTIKIERIYSDFNFLKNASGNLFNLADNPMQSYLKLGETLKLNPCRKTCCMYYKLEEDPEELRYCSNCPIKKMKEKQMRESLKQ